MVINSENFICHEQNTAYRRHDEGVNRNGL